CAEVLYLLAISYSDLSLIQSLTAVTPLIALIFSFLFLGEVPSLVPLLGVFFLLVGTYLLYVPESSGGGFFAPLFALISDMGARVLFIQQVFGVVLANIQKVASSVSSTVLVFQLVFSGAWLIFSLYLVYKRINPFLVFKDYGKVIFSSALFWASGLTVMFAAMQYLLIVYVYAINQLMPLFLIPFSYILLKEQRAFKRVLPCAIMIAGACLIIFFK
ncbi:MAG: hypothetical protein D6780_01060, partial [Candidatus Dadabacteria bacterium]